MAEYIFVLSLSPDQSSKIMDFATEVEHEGQQWNFNTSPISNSNVMNKPE